MPRGDEHLTGFRLRAVHLGLHATVLVLVAAIAWASLPGGTVTDRRAFWAIMAMSAAGGVAIWRLPWARFLHSERPMAAFYVWSCLNIALVGATVAVTGGARSDVYIIYGLTTLFYGVMYGPVAQILLLVYTLATYMAAVAVAGSDVAPATLLLRSAFIATLGYMGSFLSRELLRLIDSHRHLALHDALTGLPNRTSLAGETARAVADAERDGRILALMLLDIDRFKHVNDALGHRVGDQLLRQVGFRLAGRFPRNTVARLGGDEFAVLVGDVGDRELVEVLTERVLDVFRSPFTLGELVLDIDCSVGVSIFPDHGADPDDLFQRADVALYSSKDGHVRASVYSPGQDDDSTLRLVLTDDVRHAVERRQIDVHLQPLVELASGRIAGFEALARWMHPTLGPIEPGVFVPLAELTGSIRTITDHVLATALDTVASWPAALPHAYVAVNLSMRDLADAEFADVITRALFTRGLEPDRLEVEVTEGSLMADEEAARITLERLARLGVRVTLDDFGTGYSSLAHVRDLPVGALKIDRSFVMHMDSSPTDRAIVRSTLELARELELRVIAEGVESEDARRSLVAMGCTAGQGYHLGEPVPAREALRLLSVPAVGRAVAL